MTTRSARPSVDEYILYLLAPEMIVYGGGSNAVAIWCLHMFPALRAWPFFVGWAVLWSLSIIISKRPSSEERRRGVQEPWRMLIVTQLLIVGVTWWLLG